MEEEGRAGLIWSKGRSESIDEGSVVEEEEVSEVEEEWPSLGLDLGVKEVSER